MHAGISNESTGDAGAKPSRQWGCPDRLLIPRVQRDLWLTEPDYVASCGENYLLLVSKRGGDPFIAPTTARNIKCTCDRCGWAIVSFWLRFFWDQFCRDRRIWYLTAPLGERSRRNISQRARRIMETTGGKVGWVVLHTSDEVMHVFSTHDLSGKEHIGLWLRPVKAQDMLRNRGLVVGRTIRAPQPAGLWRRSRNEESDEEGGYLKAGYGAWAKLQAVREELYRLVAERFHLGERPTPDQWFNLITEAKQRLGFGQPGDI